LGVGLQFSIGAVSYLIVEDRRVVVNVAQPLQERHIAIRPVRVDSAAIISLLSFVPSVSTGSLSRCVLIQHALGELLDLRVGGLLTSYSMILTDAAMLGTTLLRNSASVVVLSCAVFVRADATGSKADAGTRNGERSLFTLTPADRAIQHVVRRPGMNPWPERWTIPRTSQLRVVPYRTPLAAWVLL
jgi:hypothetical protein